MLVNTTSCYFRFYLSSIVILQSSFFLNFSESKRKLKEALLRDLEENSEKETKTSSGFQKPNSKPERNFLRKSEETPTYTGGVSKEARNRMESRQNRDKERRTHASSKVCVSILSNIL